MDWVVPGELARGRRPGYSKRADGTKTVDRDEVAGWMRAAAQEGIRSILCLLDAEELALYDWLPGGLLAMYRANGFVVEGVPLPDRRYPTQTQLRAARAAWERLPKPALIHCSGGEGRTGAVIHYLTGGVAPTAAGGSAATT